MLDDLQRWWELHSQPAMMVFGYCILAGLLGLCGAMVCAIFKKAGAM